MKALCGYHNEKQNDNCKKKNNDTMILIGFNNTNINNPLYFENNL